MTSSILLFLAYLATIPAANWLIGNIGTVCVPHGPCLIPVGLGLMAPSGVMLVGAALVLRDAVHERMGWWWAVVAIGSGGAVSLAAAPPALAAASVTAFVLSEAADTLVYSPLRQRGLPIAVLLSGVVGAAVDSAAFLFLAFGAFDYIGGQVLGKIWISLAIAAFLQAKMLRRE